MRWSWKALPIAFLGGLLLSMTPAPFFGYPYPYYPYGYAPGYVAEDVGYVKIETNRKDASVCVDGGYADKVEKAKRLALRPGTHEIGLRDSDGRKMFEERVAVLVGKATKVHVG